MDETNVYDLLRLEDYKPFVETKHAGKFNADYLSWAVAWDKLKKNFPYASYKIKEYHIAINGNNLTLPYMVLPNQTGLVRIDLVVVDNVGDEHTHTEILAIRDNRMQAVTDPDACQIENTIRRCVAKGVSMMTGFGIELWFGEDIKDLDYQKPKHFTGEEVVIGKVTQDQTIKLDSLMRNRNIPKNNKETIAKYKANGWDLSEVAAQIIINDAKEGIRLNKPPTLTKVNEIKKLIEAIDVDDSKRKELMDFLTTDGLNNSKLESLETKLNKKLEN